MRELPQPGTQLLPSGIRVGLFSVMFGKQVKGFDVPARGLELLRFRSSVAILVKTCLLRGEHLLQTWGCGHHPEAWGYSTVAHVSFFSPPLSPRYILVIKGQNRVVKVDLYCPGSSDPSHQTSLFLIS